MFKFFVGVISVVGLVGCATPPLTAEQCTAANWYDVGVFDGEKGVPPGKLQRYDNQCGSFDIEPDDAEYQRGRKDGLVKYCTAEQGFVAGYKGQAYYQVCSPEAEKVFYPQYVLGSELNRVENRIFALESDLRLVDNDLSRYDRSSKWEDRRYRSWQREHLYSRLHWLYAEEFRLRSQAASLHGQTYLRPRISRFGSFY